MSTATEIDGVSSFLGVRSIGSLSDGADLVLLVGLNIGGQLKSSLTSSSRSSFEKYFLINCIRSLSLALDGLVIRDLFQVLDVEATAGDSANKVTVVDFDLGAVVNHGGLAKC